jgi:hypothetical protein
VRHPRTDAIDGDGSLLTEVVQLTLNAGQTAHLEARRVRGVISSATGERRRYLQVRVRHATFVHAVGVVGALNATGPIINCTPLAIGALTRRRASTEERRRGANLTGRGASAVAAPQR